VLTELVGRTIKTHRYYKVLYTMGLYSMKTY